METLIDKLFFSVKSKENTLFGNISGLQNLQNNSILHNIPREYQEKLIDNNWLSSEYCGNTRAKGSHFHFEPFFRTFNSDPVRRIPKLSYSAMQDHFQVSSSPLNLFGSMNSNINSLCDDISFQTLKSLFCLNKIFNLTDLGQVVLPATSMTLPADNKAKVSNSVTMNDFGQLVTSVTLPADNKTNVSSFVSKVSLTMPSLTTAKKQAQDMGDLDQQMACRKAKELNKRSKKRRRRQKKSSVKVDSNHKLKMNCEVKLPPPSQSNNSKEKQHDSCDILCDFTISGNCNSVKIQLPNMSSFVVTFESASDDDSDWDTNSEVDHLTDDTEFQISGLYVASFTSPCNLTTQEENIPCDIELDLPKSRLKDVNQTWNESTKQWDGKPKSPAMVSFAPDDKLVEILPVEMYDRKGEWEIYACERLRFKRRINELDKIISPCLNSDHRSKIYKLYQSVL